MTQNDDILSAISIERMKREAERMEKQTRDLLKGGKRMIITIKKFSKADCRPCAALANYLGDIDLFNAGATLVNIDIAEQPEAVDQYGLTSVPTLLFERNGLEVHRLVGLRGTDEIIDAIEHAKVVR